MRTGDIGCKCDRCGKLMRPFKTSQLVSRSYSKGPRFDKVNSDIKVHHKKMVDLCTECFELFRWALEDFLNEEVD